MVSYTPKATVQAAIGAIPLAMGIGGGDVILAVAVLSILVTAPLGAVGVKVMGEKVLDKDEKSAYRFKELRENAGLPRVGERIMEKADRTVWKIIEEKETWDDPLAAGKRPVPVIIFRLWHEKTRNGPGTGVTRMVRFRPGGPPFSQSFEILYDW